MWLEGSERLVIFGLNSQSNYTLSLIGGLFIRFQRMHIEWKSRAVRFCKSGWIYKGNMWD